MKTIVKKTTSLLAAFLIGSVFIGRNLLDAEDNSKKEAVGSSSTSPAIKAWHIELFSLQDSIRQGGQDSFVIRVTNCSTNEAIISNFVDIRQQLDEQKTNKNRKSQEVVPRSSRTETSLHLSIRISGPGQLGQPAIDRNGVRAEDKLAAGESRFYVVNFTPAAFVQAGNYSIRAELIAPDRKLAESNVHAISVIGSSPTTLENLNQQLLGN